MKIKVYYKKQQHLSRLITGFHLLSINNENISVEFIENCGIYETPHNQVVVIEVDNKIIAFDMCDAFSLNPENSGRFMDIVDAYFKRSYNPSMDTALSAQQQKKIFPFGFDYFVTYSGNPINGQAARGFSAGVKNTIKAITGYNKASYIDYFERKADYKEKDFKIIFMTRLWDPDEIKINPECKDYSLYMIAERYKINRDRIEIIRQLQKIYGKNFIGGIQQSPFALHECPDLIIPKYLTARKNYLDKMKSSDICIGSMGLLRSTGWKTGEYIAASRAIVAETLRYSVPGNFENGRNYLAFDSVSECLSNVEELMKSPERIYSMKKANEEYYSEYLRPEKQIMNALKQIL